MRNDFLGVYYGTTSFEIRSKHIFHFGHLLELTNAPSPRGLLIKISRHRETLHYEGGYNSLHALQFQYLQPNCEVAILAGGRDNYVGAWNILREVKNEHLRRAVLAGAVSDVVIGRSSRLSIALRLADTPTWMSQYKLSSTSFHSIPTELQMETAEMLGLPDDTKIDLRCVI